VKIKVSEKVLQAMQIYFTMNANGWLNKKTIPQIQRFINVDERTIREGIRILKTEHSVPISADTKDGGYYVVEPENKLDFEKMDIYCKRQYSKAFKILQGLKVFDQFYPEGQQLMDFPEAKALTY
jgi:hypothetical protein